MIYPVHLGFLKRATSLLPLVQHKAVYPPENPSSLLISIGFVMLSLVFCVAFCEPLFVFLSIFFWTLHCLVLPRFTSSDYSLDIFKLFLCCDWRDRQPLLSHFLIVFKLTSPKWTRSWMSNTLYFLNSFDFAKMPFTMLTPPSFSRHSLHWLAIGLEILMTGLGLGVLFDWLITGSFDFISVNINIDMHV